MRKKMQELAAGSMQYEGPVLALNPEEIRIDVWENKDYKGIFSITSTNNIAMRGIIYSDNPRMEIKEHEFQGTSCDIAYEFHTEGLIDGDIQEGNFFIICNDNEYSLHFVVSTKKQILIYNDKEIKSLDDFVMLSREDYNKAYNLFNKDYFMNILDDEKESVRLAAKLLSGEGVSKINMEEFLVITNKKPPVTYEVQYEDMLFSNVHEDIREVINVYRHGFGLSANYYQCSIY